MIDKFLVCFDYRVSGGSEYLWNCFPDARYMDFESEHGYGTILFSSKDQTVYYAEVSSADGTYAYRWLNPEFKDSYLEECQQRKVDYKIAWDTVEWVDLEVVEDFFEKASSVMNGRSFDKRIIIPLDLDDDNFLMAAKAAHSMDITINKFFEEAIAYAIEQRKAN